jgi:hypothetical protein
MTLNQMIPEVWSNRILARLEKSLVYAQPGTTMQDHSGEVSAYGDVLHFHGLSDVSLIDYQKNVTTLNYELLEDDRVSLVVDQSKAFATAVDDIDKAQQHPKVLDRIAGRASYLLAETADRHVASRYTEAAPENVTAASAFDSSNIYSKFVELSVEMSEKDIPAEGRYAVIPPAVVGMLQQNPSFLEAQREVVLNAEVGMVAGIRLLASNNVPLAAGVYSILAGVSEAIGFAQQISSVEGIRLEGSFADGLRGLHLYGSKVLRPDRLFVLEATV